MSTQSAAQANACGNPPPPPTSGGGGVNPERRTSKRVRATERGRKEMDFFILMISVPLFLVVVLLLSVFVLA
ncbi:MAG TPA: hypothetical protein VIY29_31555, partial [Ktedonobacteraceae bacterium]